MASWKKFSSRLLARLRERWQSAATPERGSDRPSPSHRFARDTSPASGRGIATALALSILSSPAFAATKAPNLKAYAKSVCAAVDKASASNNLDRNFFARLLWKESLFDPRAVSPKGAQGIAQFMPGTAERRNLADPFDPLAAVPASASFLSDLKSEFGNLGLAAAAYNAGEKRIRDWLDGKRGLPAETRDYVAFITGRVAEDWKTPGAVFQIPDLSKAGDFTSSCIQLASREVTLRSTVTRSVKLQPWGVLLAADFDEGRAMALFKRLKLRFPEKLKNAEPMILKKQNLSRGTRKMTFVMVGATTQVAAGNLCASYTVVGLPCVVRRSR